MNETYSYAFCSSHFSDENYLDEFLVSGVSAQSVFFFQLLRHQLDVEIIYFKL